MQGGAMGDGEGREYDCLAEKKWNGETDLTSRVKKKKSRRSDKVRRKKKRAIESVRSYGKNQELKFSMEYGDYGKYSD